MYNPGVQENGHDEAPPLVGLVGPVAKIRDALLVGHAAVSAELGERARERGGVEGCGVWAGPGCYLVFDDGADVVHAGGEAGAHVDKDVGGGADHDVEVWLGLNGCAG